MLVLPATPLALLLITPFSPKLFTTDSCLSSTYYGTYGTQSVFHPDAICIQSRSSLLSAASIVYASSKIQQLVWIEEMNVEEPLKSFMQDDEFDAFLERLSVSLYDDTHNQGVLALPQSQFHFEVLHRTSTTALLSVPPRIALSLSNLLPRFYKATPLPDSPIPYLPVPAPAIDHLKYLLSTLKFEPAVASIVSNISATQMKHDIRFLTGEDGMSGIVSRHSFADGSLVAARWLKERLEDTGAECELKRFTVGFAPNVVWYAVPISLRFF
jgi:hypothetical protein